MGSLVGHALPGFGFIVIGLWQLFNHIKLHALSPDSYHAPLWFPHPKIRYLELYLMMFGSSMSVGSELFFLPKKHHLFDSDGTIPTYHLHNFEHSLMSATIFTYSVFAILLDQANPWTKTQAQVQTGLAQLVGAVAFGQQFLLFHLHSADHMGVESQYHLLFQILICISLTTTLVGIAWPKSFLISFVRSVSVLFQGIWLVIMGVMLWTPSLLPKGCYLNYEEGHYVMRCHSHAAQHRGKALVNIEFSMYTILVVVFSVVFFLFVDNVYGRKCTGKTFHHTLPTLKEVELCEEDDDDSKSFIDAEEKPRQSKVDLGN